MNCFHYEEALQEKNQNILSLACVPFSPGPVRKYCISINEDTYNLSRLSKFA